jgi:hypothetical protein
MQRYSTLTPLLTAINYKHIINSKLDKIQIFVAFIPTILYDTTISTNFKLFLM